MFKRGFQQRESLGTEAVKEDDGLAAGANDDVIDSLIYYNNLSRKARESQKRRKENARAERKYPGVFQVDSDIPHPIRDVMNQ